MVKCRRWGNDIPKEVDRSGYCSDDRRKESYGEFQRAAYLKYIHGPKGKKA